MFDSLSDRLNDTFDRLRGKGKLTEADITSAMRDIRMALLEADVNFKVVKEFVAKTKERCLTAEVMESLSPAQNVVKIVLDELTEMLGSTESKLVFSNRIPNVIMLVGLQGSGKTTAAVKLAYLLKKQGRSPLLAACDVYRPLLPTSWPRSAARSACRSSAVTASTRSISPRAPSRRPSTTCAMWSSSIPPDVFRSMSR
mgnify:CR=1 FL=1